MSKFVLVLSKNRGSFFVVQVVRKHNVILSHINKNWWLEQAVEHGGMIISWRCISLISSSSKIFCQKLKPNNKLADTNHFLQVFFLLLIWIQYLFIHVFNFKPADWNVFTSQIYWHVYMTFSETQGGGGGQTCESKVEIVLFNVRGRKTSVSSLRLNTTQNTQICIYLSIYFSQCKPCNWCFRFELCWGVGSYPEPGWLSAVIGWRFHKASGPTLTGTVAPPRTQVVRGFNPLCVFVEAHTQIYVQPKHTHTHLHAQQGADTGFRGVTDGFEVMTPLQSQYYPTPGQRHELTGEEAKTWKHIHTNRLRHTLAGQQFIHRYENKGIHFPRQPTLWFLHFVVTSVQSDDSCLSNAVQFTSLLFMSELFIYDATKFNIYETQMQSTC